MEVGALIRVVWVLIKGRWGPGWAGDKIPFAYLQQSGLHKVLNHGAGLLGRRSSRGFRW